MTRVPRPALAMALAVTLGGSALAAPLARRQAQDFPHERHARVFPSCLSCHAGVADAGRPVWPRPQDCAACHDGAIEDRVTWGPRAGPRPSNLRFDHLVHAREAAAGDPADSSLVRTCGACHNAAGAERMAVQGPISDQCVACHEPSTSHLGQTNTACATCHVTLAQADRLSRDDIAAFPAPEWHEAPDFVLGGHADLARVPSGGVAASCATCHAKDFCITCHVNAPEVDAIQALASDPRSLVHEATLPVPAGHRSASFLRDHPKQAGRSGSSCAACHTSQSCSVCHAGPKPRAVAELHEAGPGRGVGAHVERRKPATHTSMFREGHGPDASSRPATCEGCHVRPDCLSCHRPATGSDPDYHPEGFLVRHPSSAWSRDATCSDCHNPAQFCQSCHQQSGLTAIRRLGAGGYHDAWRSFSLSHGQAARQSLESCASCHAERDCTTCHSAVGGGFGFSPHGPGFNAERMRQKNPSLCRACHGNAVPSSPNA